jgi:hypothetical protein
LRYRYSMSPKQITAREIFHFPYVKLISVRCLRGVRSIKHGEEHGARPTSRRGKGIIETKEKGQIDSKRMKMRQS